MAEKKNEAAPVQPVEETFELDEIAENAQRLFGYSHDIAATALRQAGIARCTLKEAQTIIKAFAERKVN